MLLPTPDAVLPEVKTLVDCADFSKTVAPYFPQLLPFFQKVFQHVTELEALKTVYVSTNPLVTALAFSLFLAPVVLIVSEVNKNYSQVDRLWSILPVIYNAHYAMWAHLVGLPTQKLDHIMAISVIWGCRLTFNYWRKGGYSIGSEDYRWEILKNYVGPVIMFIFNIVFISLAQSLLLFLITTPTYLMLLTSRLTGEGMTPTDNVISRIMFFLIILEFFADQQQWNYQQAKKTYQATAKPPPGISREALDRGFVISGLWAWSRHPNFAAEQAVWCCLYQWSCLETHTFVNWTFVGAMSYLLLFQASTWLTELLTKRKYPEYKEYQARVGKFLPKMNTRSLDTPNEERPKVQIDGKSKTKAQGKRR